MAAPPKTLDDRELDPAPDETAAGDERAPSRPSASEELDDFILLRSWSGGSRDAGAELFQRHIDAVTRFLANKVADPSDLIQSTFLACLERPQHFEGRSSFRSYLLSIARFQLYHHYRRQGLERSRLRCGTSSVLCGLPSPSSLVGKQHGDRMVLQALRMIPVELQEVLELVYWQDLSGQELAEILEVPLNTVYTRVHRAKQRLREALSLIEPDSVA